MATKMIMLIWVRIIKLLMLMGRLKRMIILIVRMIMLLVQDEGAYFIARGSLLGGAGTRKGEGRVGESVGMNQAPCAMNHEPSS